MKTARRRTLAGVVSAWVFAGMLATNFAVAQTSGEASSANLQSLTAVGSSALTYALGVVGIAQSHGLSVSSEIAFLASGNISLTAAKAALNPGGNLTAGFADVHAAMDNFTAAAADSSKALHGAGLAPAFDVQASSDTLAALNQSVSSASSAIDLTCADAVGSAVASQFAQDCAAAKSSVLNATVQLATASTIVAGARAGTPGTSTAGFAVAISQASADIASADAELTSLSAFTYATRGEAYVYGPLAVQYAAANASVELQTMLSGWFGADVSSYQAFLTAQTSTASAITGSASALAGAIPSVSTASVTTSVSAEQATLASALSSLGSFSSQVAALPLPASTVSGLQGDATPAQNSLEAYDSALSGLSSSAEGFSGTTVGGLPAYVTSFHSADTGEAAAAAAFTSSFGTFQGQVATVAGEFPLVAALGTWDTTFSQLSTSVSSSGAQVTGSASSAYASMQTASSDASSLTSAVGGAYHVEVSASIMQNVSAVHSSESILLNATALASLSSASSALQSDAQLASTFAASSQSLLSTSVAGFASASQTLASQGSALSTQGQSTSSSMSGASAYLVADLHARTQSTASAKSLVSQAISAFEAGQVSKAASLVSQASALFALASSPA